MNAQNAAWRDFLRGCTDLVAMREASVRSGKLTKVAGLVMEATGVKSAIGSQCLVELPSGHSVDAEVVGFADNRVYLMATRELQGLVPGARVVPCDVLYPQPKLGAPYHPRRRAADRMKQMPVGPELLGRVVDATGLPLDEGGALKCQHSAALQGRVLNPLHRAPIRTVLDVGVRAINGLLTVGRGQRVGLFAGSGVGKSVLLGMMARYTSADVVVVGLIGERGREVQEFIEQILGEEGLKRSVVVAAPADTSPVLRLQGASYATAIAEFFRDQGKSVLLIMDSLTRVAMAQREVALAIGEPPATKGYPPSVFALLPQLVERTGNARPGGGSITAFYTVLTEGDDQQDPVADSARAILDGHIVLSRGLAEQGRYPAIDIEASISRAMTSLISPQQFELVRKFKQLYSRYQRNRDLVNLGAYVAGSDALLDQAIALYPSLERYLQQSMTQRAEYRPCVEALEQLLANVADKPQRPI
jgi:flagellum-specific ATP synthase